MIVYFTGTGNSRYAADYLGERLEDKVTDAVDLIKAGKKAEFTSQTPWIFVAPTYAWQMPRVFREWLKNGQLSGSKEAYFVLTCGGDIGNAGAGAEALCQEMGLNYRGILEVVMPENFIAMFSAPDADKAMKIIEAAGPVLKRGANDIKHGKDFPPKKSRLLDGVKSGIVNDLFYKKYVTAKHYYATDKCVGCGHCVTACPMNNIRMDNRKPAWSRNCTQCMACICGCPTQAIEYGNKSKGKHRYQCPTYNK